MGDLVGFKQLWQSRPDRWYRPSLLFVVQRTILTGLGLILYLLGLVPQSADPVTRPYFGITPDVEGLSGALLGVWQRFDVIHFLRIAQSGYSEPDLTAFFPLYPASTGVLGRVFGGEYLLAGFVIANAATLVAVNLLYFWLLDEGFEEEIAFRSVLYMVWFPASFFLFVPYSESLFLLLALASLWAGRRRRWLLAGSAAAFATAARFGGIVLAPVLILEWARGRIRKRVNQTLRAWFGASMPLIVFAGLWLWRSARGLPNIIQAQASYWQRVPALPWEGSARTVGRIGVGEAAAIEYLDLAVVLGALLLGLAVIRRLPPSLGLYYWGLLLLGLMQYRVGQPLSGQARFAIALVPAFVVLAQVAQGPIARRIVSYSFLSLHLLLAGQFILWGWVG